MGKAANSGPKSSLVTLLDGTLKEGEVGNNYFRYSNRVIEEFCFKCFDFSHVWFDVGLWSHRLLSD
uniref:Uncharacterized protein n=1 Tax=Helianthus annuus TaxID=4232 RepID=A0A251UKW6_HELAN